MVKSELQFMAIGLFFILGITNLFRQDYTSTALMWFISLVIYAYDEPNNRPNKNRPKTQQ